ncbi:MAG: Hint domain-containing protein [Pseudomonadota bacterium]
MKMGEGFRGTFVIDWVQVELDGLTTSTTDALAAGAVWKWRGQAVRVDGPSDVLLLHQCEDAAELRRHVARAAQRLAGNALARVKSDQIVDDVEEEALLPHGFSVTDGSQLYNAAVIERDGQSSLCVFLDKVPPRDRDLWVSDVAGLKSPQAAPDQGSDAVICFTQDALIATPNGPVAARDLNEGDYVLTKDGGAMAIRWIGQRRLSGARLYTMPHLRPVRIRAGALECDLPQGDLLVSPEHRLLIKGAMATALFNEPEVLVAARDLINDRTITSERRLREVTYIHIMLDQHAVVFANGVECDTFHPAAMQLTSMSAPELARLDSAIPGIVSDPSQFGGFARRMLSRSEAAILVGAAEGLY